MAEALNDADMCAPKGVSSDCWAYLGSASILSAHSLHSSIWAQHTIAIPAAPQTSE
jgi:hypothetical protein